MENNIEEKTLYYKRLDIIRILSCILVLLYHLNVLKGGFLTVCTFFVLSGYLTCISALNHKNFSIKLYYKNRIKKLYFPLIIVVFLTVIFVKIANTFNWINLKQETLSVIFGYNNIWQLKANQDYFTRNMNSPFIHLWYISILLQFDLLFPLIFTFFKKVESKIKSNISTIVVTISTVLSMILFCYLSKTQDFMMAYYNTFARSFSILFGVLLALMHYKYNIKFSRLFEKYNKQVFIIYIIALISMCMFIHNNTERYAFFMILATFISTRLIEYSIYESKKTNKIDKYIKAMSKMSYEIYLVQCPVIFFMQNLLISDNLKCVLVFCITLIISFILHLLLNTSKSNKTLKNIICSIIIILGSFLVLTSKDYTNEMKELENRLNENLKFMQEKNDEFLNSENDDENEEENITPENSKNEVTNNTAKKIENEETNIIAEKSDSKPWKVISEKSENKAWKSTSGKKENKENNIIAKNTEKAIKENSKKDTTSESTKNKEINIEEKVKNLRVIGVGDSVLLDATKAFYNKFPKGYFDGKISRTVSGAKDVLMNLKNRGKLGNTIILCLATNGDYSDRKNRELMNILGNRKVYWVNAVGADDPKFNDKFKKFARNYPNIHIVEWEKEAKKHPEYLEPDKIHPNYKGGKAMVKLIFDTICSDY